MADSQIHLANLHVNSSVLQQLIEYFELAGNKVANCSVNPPNSGSCQPKAPEGCSGVLEYDMLVLIWPVLSCSTDNYI
jgi:hypothetical protein